MGYNMLKCQLRRNIEGCLELRLCLDSRKQVRKKVGRKKIKKKKKLRESHFFPAI